MEGQYYSVSVSIHLILIFLVFPVLAFSHSSAITYLPGFPGRLPFHLETGYVRIDESGDVQLFYYFVKSESSPENDPLLLWITGGPGCSSFTAFVEEIGPLRFEDKDYDGSLPSLVLNPNSWTQASNILFLDTPVGTGFSYSTSVEGLTTGDKKSCHQADRFLRKWLLDHPEFLPNPVYIGGDSYGGKIVPIFVQDILDGNEVGNKPFINFKGYLIGNPVTNSSWDDKEIPYAHGMGLISDENYESVKRSCGGKYKNVNPSNVLCLKDINAYLKCVRHINVQHILKPVCQWGTPKLEAMVKYPRFLVENVKGFSGPMSLRHSKSQHLYHKSVCKNNQDLITSHWANDNRVRKALHIREPFHPVVHQTMNGYYTYYFFLTAAIMTCWFHSLALKHG